MLATKNLNAFRNLFNLKYWQPFIIVKFNYNEYLPYCSKRSAGVRFEQLENMYFHKVLQRNKNYSKTIAFLDFVRESKTDVDVDTVLSNNLSDKPAILILNYMKDILHLFRNHTERFSEPEFVSFCTILNNKLREYTDDQLLDLLKILTLWPRTERKNLFYEICKNLDEELTLRDNLWTRDKRLLTMDHFYRLEVIKFSEFFWKNMRRICNEPFKLTPAQLVHAMFLINSQRSWHPSVKLYVIEEMLLEIIYEISIEEAAIVALAFFKTVKPIQNKELLRLLYIKLEQQTDSVNSLPLTAFLKVFRLSTKYDDRDKITRLLDKLMHRINEVTLTCSVHMALLGTQCVVFHPPSLKKICDRFVREISSARLKELDRILFILELYNYDPQTEPNIFDVIIQELYQRKEEIQMYPKNMISAINYLTLRKIYVFDLLNEILSKEFLKYTFTKISKFGIPREVLQISCGIKLECPDYKGNNLDDEFVKELSKNFCLKMPKLFEKKLETGSRIILRLKDVLEKMYNGEEFVYYVYLLPYSPRPELIICLKDKTAVKIPDSMKSNDNYLSLQPPPNIGNWYAFLLWSFSMRIADTDKPVGSLLARIRHLKILGYKPLLVNDRTWENVNICKEDYVKRLIAENQ